MENREINLLTEKIIGCTIEVHKELGSGLLESVYHQCLEYEFMEHGIRYEREVSIPIKYKNVELDAGFRADFIVEDTIILELKAVETMLPVHEAQLLTYLKVTGKKVGLLLNFNVPVMKEGIRRMVHGL